jgi:hypothetical protein
MVGVDGETDMSEDQEAELSADLEVVIGKEEIVVGEEEVAGQGKYCMGQLYLPEPI